MGERGPDAQREQGIADQRALGLAQQRDERREVHREEAQVTPHRHVEELVAVELVRRRERHRDVRDDDGEREGDEKAPGRSAGGVRGLSKHAQGKGRGGKLALWPETGETAYRDACHSHRSARASLSAC